MAESLHFIKNVLFTLTFANSVTKITFTPLMDFKKSSDCHSGDSHIEKFCVVVEQYLMKRLSESLPVITVLLLFQHTILVLSNIIMAVETFSLATLRHFAASATAAPALQSSYSKQRLPAYSK